MPNSPKVERKLAAIMFTDIVGYSKIMNNDENSALKIFDFHNEILEDVLFKFKGKLIKNLGDGTLIEFNSILDAAKCAISFQNRIIELNKIFDEIFSVRIGIHIGDIIKKNNDIFGDGINVASRIINFSVSNGICLSKEAAVTLKGYNEIITASIGLHELKNIAGKWDLHRVFLSKEDFKNWSESNYLESKLNKRKAKKFKNIINIIFFIMIGFLLTKFISNQYLSYLNEKQILQYNEKIYDIFDIAFDLDFYSQISNEQLMITIPLSYLYGSGSITINEDKKSFF